MNDKSDPFILGITGNIGSGKSTVAHLWERYNVRIIEGDAIGHEVVDESEEFRDWLKKRFGTDLFQNNALKRAELGRIVFSDEAARDDLNAAIWPYIRERLQSRIEESLRDGFVALVDAAMIYEWNDEDRYDVIVAVITDPHIGAQRAASRMELSVEEISKRYRMQIPAETKSRRSDFTIRNNGDLNDLRAKAFGVWPHVGRRGREAAEKRTNS